MLCFGGKSGDAHRGAKISNLIRWGHDGNAEIKVTLYNTGKSLWNAFNSSSVHSMRTGSDAYKHGEYGDEITIERTIAKA